MGHWEHFPHGADIGVRGFGHSMSEAFSMTAEALTAVVTEPGEIQPLHSVSIECEAPDHETLLVDFLSAIIYEMSVRKMVFGGFQVRVEAGRLTAELRGEPVEPQRHRPAVEVKGATYTELEVRQEGRNWVTQCVVDV